MWGGWLIVIGQCLFCDKEKETVEGDETRVGGSEMIRCPYGLYVFLSSAPKPLGGGKDVGGECPVQLTVFQVVLRG